MVLDLAVCALAANAPTIAGVHTAASRGAGGCSRAVGVREALGLGLAALATSCRVGITYLAVPACAFEAARHIAASGSGVAGTGLAASGSALIDINAKAVSLGLLVAILAVANGPVVHCAAGASATLDVLAGVSALEGVLVAGECIGAVVVGVTAHLVAANVGICGIAAMHRRA